MKLRLTVLVFLFCFFSFNLNAEENEQDLLTDESVFIIDSVDFNITGKTRSNAILFNSEIKTGDVIQGYSNFLKYIEEKKQLLVNQRLFETVDIYFYINEKQDDGYYPVNLLLLTKDSGNFMVLPDPQYSSNTGLSVNLKVRHYNFLGTMIPLKVEFGYRYDQNKNNNFSFANDTGIPFRFLNLNWIFNFDNELRYRAHLDNPFFYSNNSGLTIKVPVSVINIDTTAFINMLVNNENSDAEKPVFGDTYTGFYAVPGIKNSINFGRIDWITNIRDGVFLDLSNSYQFNMKKQNYNFNPHEINTAFTGIYHKNVMDILGFSVRLLYRYNYMNYLIENAADALRGIMDEDIKAKHILSLNMDLPAKLITFFPHKWYGIDLFLGPFLDMALYDNFNDLLITSGFELTVYLYRFRSLYFRISFGAPVKGPENKKTMEFYFGTDLAY